MPTVAHIVQKIVREKPHLEQFIERDLVSFHKLARYLKPGVESELGKEVDAGAIVMALSRLKDKMKIKRGELGSGPALKKIEVSLKSDALQADVKKSANTEKVLLKVQKLAGSSPGDILSITQAAHEVSIIAPAKYEKRLQKMLKGERVLNFEKGLSLLMLRFGEDVLYQPGFFDRVLRELAWENINIYEIVSTLTELIIVLKDEEAAKAYSVIRKIAKN